MIKEKIEVSDDILAFGGFGDVRRGTYHGHLVAVKTARVAAWYNLWETRKVSADISYLARGPDYSSPAVFQRSHPLEHAVPSERLETYWG